MKHSNISDCFSSQYSITFVVLRGYPNLEICVKYESQHWLKWYSATHKWLVNAVGSFSHMPYAYKEGYETLKQQWLSLPTVQYHICCAEREPQIWKLVWNLRVDIGGNDTVQHINGWWMLAEASPICLTHLRKVMKHSNSNGCLSLQYSITFAVLRWYPKSGNFVKFESQHRPKW